MLQSISLSVPAFCWKPPTPPPVSSPQLVKHNGLGAGLAHAEKTNTWSLASWVRQHYLQQEQSVGNWRSVGKGQEQRGWGSFWPAFKLQQLQRGSPEETLPLPGASHPGRIPTIAAREGNPVSPRADSLLACLFLYPQQRPQCSAHSRSMISIC